VHGTVESLVWLGWFTNYEKRDRIHLKLSCAVMVAFERARSPLHAAGTFVACQQSASSSPHLVQRVGYALTGSSSALYILRGKSASPPVQK